MIGAKLLSQNHDAFDKRICFLEIFIVMLVGGILSLFAAWLAHDQEVRLHIEAFRQLANSKVLVLMARFQNLRDVELDGLARFIENSRGLEPAEFQRYNGRLVLNPFVQAWNWVPIVPINKKKQMEIQARNQGKDHFSIWQRGPAGNRVPAEDRKVYYPIYFVSPLSGNKSSVGFDLGSDFLSQKTLRETMKTRLTTCSAPVILPGKDGKVILIYRPIAGFNGKLDLKGFAVAVMSMDDLLKSSVSDRNVAISFSLASKSKLTLLSSSFDQKSRFTSRWSLVRPILAFGKTFFVHIHSRPDFERSHPLRAGWMVFFSCLALTSAMIFFLTTALNRRRQLEKIVADRTFELQNLRNYLSNIINSMPSVLIGVDPSEKVTQWNNEAQKLTGITSRDALGKPLQEAFPRIASEITWVHEAMKTRKVHGGRRHRTLENEVRYEDVTVYPLIANGINGAVIRIDDVTDRVRLEEMMLQSEKMLSVGGLAAGMAHEINNPLGGMMQTANVMKNRLTNLDLASNLRVAKEVGVKLELIREYMKRRKIDDMLDRIVQSGKRAAEIISNMLSFARKGASTYSSHDIGELLDKCLDMAGADYDLKKHYDFRQIEIIREYAEDLPYVYCEPVNIQQVFLNILRNGAEAMNDVERKSCFVLRLMRDKPGWIRVEIEDNGPGMEEEIRKRIFEPFFTTKPIHQGTGLGLSVSYFIIVKNHKGKMMIESTPGEGTKFLIYLPIHL